MSLDLIIRDPEVMNGQACVKGTRLTVSRVLSAMASYPNRAELFENYPELTEEALKQVLAFSAAAVEDRVIDLVGTK